LCHRIAPAQHRVRDYVNSLHTTRHDKTAMHLLIKISSKIALAAHIPDAHGLPLCGLNLKLADWHLADRLDTLPLICGICKRKQAKARHQWDGMR
jgi:hypothetical protein